MLLTGLVVLDEEHRKEDSATMLKKYFLSFNIYLHFKDSSREAVLDKLFTQELCFLLFRSSSGSIP